MTNKLILIGSILLATTAHAVTIYIVRQVCDTEIGDRKGFHYIYEDQTVIDCTFQCPTHKIDGRDCVIVSIDEPE